MKTAPMTTKNFRLRLSAYLNSIAGFKLQAAGCPVTLLATLLLAAGFHSNSMFAQTFGLQNHSSMAARECS